MLAAAAAASQIAFAANRTPTSFGDIYRIAENGALVNLTHSPAADRYPAASPDGKRVAFVRLRARTAQAYVVGADGRGLRALGPQVPNGGVREGSVAAISWAPDNRHLAIAVSQGGRAAGVFVTSLSGGWIRVGVGGVPNGAAWSADSSRLAFTTTNARVRVVSRQGRALWSTTGEGAAAFSRTGLLAVRETSDRIGVYDVRGRERVSFTGNAFAWSGDRLASVRNGLLEVRRGTTLTTTVRVAAACDQCDARIVWVGSNAVRLRGKNGTWIGVDVAHRRLLPGTQPFGTVWSVTGAAAHTRFGSPTASLVRGTTTVRTVPSCNSDEPFENVQFLGRTNALVYQSGCQVPSADIYTVAPDGSSLRQVTHTYTDEFMPALSPDGTRMVWSTQEIATFCKGCPHNLVLAPNTSLTNDDDDVDAPFNDYPSFSPDGTQIAFVKSGANADFSLYTIPAGGGTPTKLGVTGTTHATWGNPGIAFVKGYNPTAIQVIDPATHAVKTLATVEQNVGLGWLTWSPDGRLAYVEYDDAGPTIVIVGGRSFRLHLQHVTGLAWSPDGTRFAFVADDANGWGEVFTIGDDGAGLRQVTRNLNVVGNLSWR